MNQVYTSQAIVLGNLKTLHQVLQEEYRFVDCEALGRWCGLPGDWWSESASVSMTGYLTLLRQLHHNDVPNIVLRVANRSSLATLGVMGYAILASPKLIHGLQMACTLIEQTFQFVRLSVSTTRDQVFIAFRVVPEGGEFYQQLVEVSLISMWRYIQLMLPDGLAPCASYACLNYAAPAYHWQYQQLLGCKVDFGQNHSSLAIPRQWLQVASQPHTQQATALFSGQARRMRRQEEPGADIVNQVKRLLVEKPHLCRYSLELTAPLMSLSARTLRRHLQVVGSSFRQICLEVRMELAQDYLINTPLTVQEIAYQLGYNQATNFYRAFRQHMGETPEQLRQQGRLAEQGG